jgi:lipopolysaccharide transport system ATP-binding protein
MNINNGVINFDCVCKRYRIHYQGFRHLVQNAFSKINIFGNSVSTEDDKDFIWALKDVSFTVKQGEILGIIGPNGAGKTTILKILSNITNPTSGNVQVKGRVGALIEVGAGFHPELTGRENIYLNGSILGLTKKEIDKKFDSIVEFSELEKFLDTPVKKYSSGMYVRLGFSIAVHMEPDILLIDEVLAVGDINFQNKSLNKMLSFKNKNTSIVFVSHNLSNITALCDKAIYLWQGKIRSIGSTESAISAYWNDYDKQKEELSQKQFEREDLEIKDLVIKKIALLNTHGKETNNFRYKDDIAVRIYYHAHKKIMPYFIIIVGGLFGANMLLDGQRHTLEGTGFFDCIFKSVSLLPGNYPIEIIARGEAGMYHIVRPRIASTFNIISSIEEYGLKGKFALAESRSSTPILHPYEWKFYD